MANLNLSQFGENTSVSDADYTFVWDSAASISKKVSRNSWLNSGTLTSDAPVTISQTWNQIGTAFTAFKVNAVSTASAAGSLLADFQVGGVSQFSVSKVGAMVSAFSITSSYIQSNANFVLTTDAGAVVWGATPDTWLRRDGAANTLALRNGAAAQTFNVYGTYTSGSVYERMFMRYNGTALAFQVGAETVGATARPLEFLTAGTRKLVLTATGNNTATIYSVANSTANILTLRNLSETAKFEFNLNASGNASFAMGSVNLISEVGNSYFNGGNVGIGTTSPTSKLHVVGDAVLTGDLLGTNYTIGVPTILTQSNISITNNHNGVADSAIVITPKGVGAFILGPKPDGTATGGNARGSFAVDNQINRNSNTQIASGANSVISGGAQNRASGSSSVVCGGVGNVASSTYSAVCAGNTNTSSGQYAIVSGGVSNFSSADYAAISGGANNTASAIASAVCGGIGNTASAQYAYVGGGSSNSASGLYSFIIGGQYAAANRAGISAHANGRFIATGDAQTTKAVFRNKTTTNAAVELFLDGASARYTVTSGKIISMLINITGTKSDGSAVAHYVRQYSIKNIGGTTSQVYAAVTVGTDNAAGTSIAISADDTNDSLKIEVTGVTDEIWRWVASVDAVEVGHGV